MENMLNYWEIENYTRISAYDVVIPTAIPGKGAILNQMSTFWFNKTKSIISNHLMKPA